MARMDAKEFTAAKLGFYDRLTMDTRLKDLDTRVAWQILKRINLKNDYTAWPSHALIAREVGCHSGSVRRAIARLCGFGWIDKITHRGRHMTCTYSLNLVNRTLVYHFNDDGGKTDKFDPETGEIIENGTQGYGGAYSTVQENGTQGYYESIDVNPLSNPPHSEEKKPANDRPRIVLPPKRDNSLSDFQKKQQEETKRANAEAKARNRIIADLGLSANEGFTALARLQEHKLLSPLEDKEINGTLTTEEILEAWKSIDTPPEDLKVAAGCSV